MLNAADTHLIESDINEANCHSSGDTSLVLLYILGPGSWHSRC